MHISWGMMLRSAFSSGVMAYAWWWILPPGMSIAVIVLGFTFLGNAIHEASTPMLRA
jgi:peptide/nickel transport system permease protein